MSVKLDRALFEVQFVTWLPADERMAAQGQLGTNQKVPMGARIWAPVPVDANGRVDVSLMPYDEQGGPWAMREIARRKPDGREVLAVMGFKDFGIMESSIVNQPKRFDDDLGLSRLDEAPATEKKSIIFKP